MFPTVHALSQNLPLNNHKSQQHWEEWLNNWQQNFPLLGSCKNAYKASGRGVGEEGQRMFKGVSWMLGEETGESMHLPYILSISLKWYSKSGNADIPRIEIINKKNSQLN